MNLEQFEEKLKKYVQANEQDLIQSLAWLVAQPSVSSTGEGVLEGNGIGGRTGPGRTSSRYHWPVGS